MTPFVGLREALALTVGVPVGLTTFSWGLVAYQLGQPIPPWVAMSTFGFFLTFALGGVVAGYMASGFHRRAVGVFLVSLLILPVALLAGWVLSGALGAWLGPMVSEAARPAVAVSGHYMILALLIAIAAEDLKRTWERREAGRDGGDRLG